MLFISAPELYGTVLKPLLPFYLQSLVNHPRLSFQAQSRRNVGSATLRLSVFKVLVVSVNPGFRGTAPSAVQSHVSVLQLSRWLMIVILNTVNS